MKKNPDPISLRFHSVRKKMGLSVGEAAQMCNVSVSWWHDRRKAERVPTPQSVSQVSAALAVDEHWILTGTGDEPQWDLLPIVASELRPRRNMVRETNALYGTEPRVAARMVRQGERPPVPERNLDSAVRDLAAFLGVKESLVWEFVSTIVKGKTNG
jgi:transcriptional regulator with XRE-family HTH domain